MTGELWQVEHAAQGGDDANIVLPGRNYGWPVVSFGREYSGQRISGRWWQEGMELAGRRVAPLRRTLGDDLYRRPLPRLDRCNLFVESMMVARVERTGHIERVVLNESGEEIRREAILTELHQRIPDVRQGPDGLIYAITDEDDGVLLRVEPGTR